MRSTTLILALIFSVLASQAARAETDIGLQGWHEALVSVSDLQTWKEVLQEVGDWAVVDSGEVSPEQLITWGLDAKTPARYLLMGNPGTDSGWLRLLDIQAPQRQQMRSNDQSWDTGGIFDLNMRIRNMEQVFSALQARNWQAASDPVEFQFGQFHVKEWIVRGPDGVRLALIERIAPTLEGWPHLKGFSRSFNSTQIVSDMDASLRFYRDILGMKTYMEHHGASRSKGPNVLGLPHNLATEVVRHVYILHPEGVNEGSIELLSFDGASGADFSAEAWLPHLGIASLRIPCDDIEALKKQFVRHEYPLESDITELTWEPYGRVKTLRVAAPDGNRLEFYQQM